MHIESQRENVAQQHQQPTYERTRLEDRPASLLPSDRHGMVRVMDYIFNNTQWYRDYEEMTDTFVTMWSNRFDELIERIDDLHGLYKNRPASEAIAIMMLFTNGKINGFGMPPVNEFVSNIAIEYRIASDPGYGVKWMIDLPQINVVLFALDITTPGCMMPTPLGSEIIIHPSFATKITSMTAQHISGHREMVRVAGVFFPYLSETKIRIARMSDIALLGISAPALDMRTLAPGQY